MLNIHELMCRLYKSLGEYDVVNAILSKHVTTHQVTLQAIEAEVRGDYIRAAKLYNQVACCSAFIDGDSAMCSLGFVIAQVIVIMLFLRVNRCISIII